MTLLTLVSKLCRRGVTAPDHSPLQGGWRQAAHREPEAAWKEAPALEARAGMQEALRRVPNAQRNVLELYYAQGMTLNEIAQVLGCSVTTVKTRFYEGHLGFIEELQQPQTRSAHVPEEQRHLAI